MLIWLWLKKAGAWLKANWKSVLLGIFTLGIGLLVGKALKKPSVVVAPELVGAEEERQKAQEAEDKARAKAAQERADKLEEVEKAHSETIKQLTDGQREKVDELRDDPEKLNSYLISVGKDLRGS